MNCETFRAEIDESDRRSRPSAGAAAHLARCTVCGIFYRERMTLRGLVSELEMVLAPADFEFRLRARMASEKDHQGGRGGVARWSFAPGALTIALPACCVLVIGLAVSQNYRRPQLAEDIAKPPTETALVSLPNVNPVNRESTIGAATSVETIRSQTTMPSTSRRINPGGRRVPSTVRTPSLRVARVASTGVNESVESTSLSVRGAGVIEARPLVGVPMSAAAQTVLVAVRDARGVDQIVSIAPVSFGAQQLVERANATAQVSAQPKEVVW
ncbi:MAG: hypothetical protein M3R15_33710 [Acidobacteriota bacterium]|nr:hypothetical protein [Acidobacteriota bacterium]